MLIILNDIDFRFFYYKRNNAGNLCFCSIYVLLILSNIFCKKNSISCVTFDLFNRNFFVEILIFFWRLGKIRVWLKQT